MYIWLLYTCSIPCTHSHTREKGDVVGPGNYDSSLCNIIITSTNNNIKNDIGEKGDVVGPGNYDPSLAPTRPNARGSDFSRSKSARTSITRAVPQVKEINDNNNQMFLFLFVKKKNLVSCSTGKNDIS